MCGIILDVKSEKFNMTVPLERRITFLRGDSGVGKSTLVEMLRLSFTNRGIKVDCNKRIVLLNEFSSAEDLKSYNNALIILDDLMLSEKEGFSSILSDCLIDNDLYVLIINRIDIKGIDSLDYYVLNIIPDGVNYNIVKYYDRR